MTTSEGGVAKGPLLMFLAFLGIFVYGLLSALPGSVLPTLERSGFLPTDKTIGDFLLINALGAVLAYLASGPIIDRLGKKVALTLGCLLVIGSMAGFALTVNRVEPQSARFLIFACALVLGLGANAIVSAGHALVAHVASSWRNAALNLLDICFGLGLAALPLVVQILQRRGGLELIFWALAAAAGILVLLVSTFRFPPAEHAESFPVHEAGGLLRQHRFWLLAVALFMYVGAEVSVGKWVVTYMERDPRLLAGMGIEASHLQSMTPDALTRFFEASPVGAQVATFALRTLSWFAFALLLGRLVSSLLLGVLRLNSLWLLALGSAITTVALFAAFTTGDYHAVRWAMIATGFGMGPVFPTSVGLASVMAPRISGTAMSLAMGIGFAGLLVIPPAVGYISDASGGQAGDLRSGLMVVLAAAVMMLMLHIVLALRQRRS